MHIVYLNPSAQLGGAEICLLDVLAVTAAMHPDWKLSVVLPEDGPLVSRIVGAGANVHVLAMSKGLMRAGESGNGRSTLGRSVRLTAKMGLTAAAATVYGRALSRLLRKLRPDLVYSNGFKMHVLGALTLPKNAPLLWHVHDYIGPRPLMRRALRVLSSRVHHIVATSNNVAADLRANLAKTRAPISTVYNAFDDTVFQPDGTRLDLDFLSGLPPAEPGTLRIGLPATMAWWKGHRVFIEAIRQLPRDISVRAYVIGGPIYRTRNSQVSLPALRQFAAQCGVFDRVGFTGFISDTASAMRALDVVVHASTEPEPFGRVIIEAMACGKPVITTGIGGCAEIVDAGPGATVVPPNDPAALALAIVRICTESDLRHKRAAQSLATVVKFSRTRLSESLAQVYWQLRPSTTDTAAMQPLEVNA